MARFAHFLLDRSLNPHPRVTDPENIQRSRLLSAILLVLSLVGATILALVLYDDPRDIKEPTVQGALVLLGIMVGMYMANRLGYTPLAVGGVILPFVGIFIYIPFFSGEDPLFLVFLVVPILLTAVFFSLRWTIMVSVVILSGVFVLMSYQDQVSPTSAFWNLRNVWFFLLLATGLVVTFMWHLGELEGIRQRELKRANEQLERDIALRRQAEEKLRSSDERLRLALAAAHMGTWDWDILTGAVTWSEHVEAIFGLPPGGFPGDYAAYLDLVHAEDRGRVEQVIAETLAGRQADYVVHHRVAWPDGSVHWLEGRGQVYGDAMGRPVRMAGTVADITKRKAAEAALRESEERFARLAEATLEGIGVSDQGKVIDANPQLAEMLGYAPSEMIGMNVLDLVAPESRDLVAQSGQSGYDQPYEHLAVRKDGSIFPVEVRAKAIPYQGRMVRVTAIRDMTERKRAEEQLRESADKIRAVFEAATDGISVTNLAGDFVDANDAVVRLHGYQSKDEFLGCNAIELIVENDRPRALEYVRRTLEGGRSDWLECWLLRKDGNPFCGELSTALLKDAQGNPVGVVGITRDITARKQAEAALQNYAARLEILHEIDRAILAAHSPEEIASAALSGVRQLAPCRRASVAIFDLPARQATILAVSVNGETGFGPVPRVPLEFFGDLTLLQQGQPRVVEDLTSQIDRLPNADQLIALGMLRSALVMPLLVSGELIGSLNLEADEPKAFGAGHMDIAREVTDQLAIAIRQARLFEATRRQLDELTVLHRVTIAAAEAGAEDELIERATQIIGEALYPDNFGVMLVDEVAGVLRDHKSFQGASPAGMQAAIPLGQGIVGTVAARGQPWRVPDVSREPAYIATNPATRSELCVPLKVGERIIGVIDTESSKLDAFREADEQLLLTVAGQLATAIAKIRLFKAEQHRSALLRALHETGLDLSAQLDLSTLLRTIMERAARLLDAPMGGLYLFQPDHQILEPVANLPPDDIVAPVHVGEGLVGRVAQTGAPLVVTDYNQWPGRLASLENPPFRAVVGVPIKWQEQALGVVSVCDPRPGRFSPDDAEVVRLFAAQAAVAIQNAQLFEQVRSGREQLQTLSRRLVEVQEEERRHIARELHDEIGQTLTGLKLVLQVIPRLPAEAAGAKLKNALQLVNELMERVHDLSLDLRPAMLDDLGLPAALMWLFERFQAQTGVLVKFEFARLEERLAPEVETTAYRIVQEALTNVARHARVHEAAVWLLADDSALRIQIQDEGPGFDVPTALATRQRAGVVSMKERAALLGGWLTVDSAPGSGTQVIASLPLHGRPERRQHDRLDSFSR